MSKENILGNHHIGKQVIPKVILSLLCLLLIYWLNTQAPSLSPTDSSLLTFTVIVCFAIILVPTLPEKHSDLRHLCKQMAFNLCISWTIILILLITSAVLGYLPLLTTPALLVLLATFLFFLYSLSALIWSLTNLDKIARTTSMLIGFLLIASIFYMNPIVDGLTTESSRVNCIVAMCYSNPWLIGNAYALDNFHGQGGMPILIKKTYLYDLSVIGAYYGMNIVNTFWYFASLLYIATGIGCAILAIPVIKLRNRRKSFSSLEDLAETEK